MKDAVISDTVVYGLSQLLNASNKMLSAVGMLFLQNVINFLSPGHPVRPPSPCLS